MSSPKRILVCPLDWGLGHATRCIPIIRLLIEKNHEVIIAGDGSSIELLKQEFPPLKFVFLKGYRVNYNQKNMVLNMLFSIPKIAFRILTEHRQLKKIVREHNIGIVISDNRYGLWNKKIKSIFITHQLMIKSPFAEKLLHQLVLFFIKKYDECWIPDIEGENNLSGDLAHKYPLPKNASFIGVLSRFEKKEMVLSYVYDVMVIISGPEPQRSAFEKIALKQLKQTSLKALVVCGKPEEQTETEIGNIKKQSHLNSRELQKAIEESKVVIARSGYSTIMDLAVLNKKALLIPTPGQTEQEYLAERLMKKRIAFVQNQEQVNIETGLEENNEYFGLNLINDNSVLRKKVGYLVQ